jgi:D-amino peptidase
MKVYLSVDMEGLAGISHHNPTGRGDAGYPAAVELMTAEANAAIAGCRAAGATDILVNDSHGGMYNLDARTLDPAARLLQGQKVWSMVAGAGPDAGFEVALFVGYHARAGHPTGTIAHTYSGKPTETRLNGRLVGETGLNASVLGQWGIPVGLVTGDDAKAVQADFAAIVPGAERIGDRGVRHLGEDPVGAYRGFLAGFRLAGIVD